MKSPCSGRHTSEGELDFHGPAPVVGHLEGSDRFGKGEAAGEQRADISAAAVDEALELQTTLQGSINSLLEREAATASSGEKVKASAL